MQKSLMVKILPATKLLFAKSTVREMLCLSKDAKNIYATAIIPDNILLQLHSLICHPPFICHYSQGNSGGVPPPSLKALGKGSMKKAQANSNG